MVTITNPKPDSSVVRKIICKSCGVELEYLPVEVLTRSGTDYSGGPDGEEYIVCPNCGERVIIRAW